MDQRILDAFRDFSGLSIEIGNWTFLFWGETEEGLPKEEIDISKDGRTLARFSPYQIKEMTCQCKRGPLRKDKFALIGVDGKVLYQGKFKDNYVLSKFLDEELFEGGGYNEEFVEKFNHYLSLYKQYALPKGGACAQ